MGTVTYLSIKQVHLDKFSKAESQHISDTAHQVNVLLQNRNSTHYWHYTSSECASPKPKLNTLLILNIKWMCFSKTKSQHITDTKHQVNVLLQNRISTHYWHYTSSECASPKLKLNTLLILNIKWMCFSKTKSQHITDTTQVHIRWMCFSKTESQHITDVKHQVNVLLQTESQHITDTTHQVNVLLLHYVT